MTSLKSTRLVAGCLTASLALVLTPTSAIASPAPDRTNAVQVADFRQLIGEVSGPTFLEASVPANGTYLLEYQISGMAFFDTYVDGTELGYVGGPDGTYRTRTLTLSAGGHLVEAVGPEGSGTARLYLVQIS